MNCAMYAKASTQKQCQHEATITHRGHQTGELERLEERKRTLGRQGVASELDGRIVAKADRCHVFVRRR
jgi:hypothetical protein